MDAEPRTLAGKRLWADWSNMEPGMLDAILAIEAEARADTGLDAAWKAAEAALPDGWRVEGVEMVPHNDQPWAAFAGSPLPDDEGIYGFGSTPAAALLALAARLGEGRE